jgi:putative MFS transporter
MACPADRLYITEIARTNDRGRFVLLYELVFPIGIMAVGLAGYWIVPRFGWRWLFVIGGSAALLCLYMRRAIPESPRWKSADPSSAAHPVKAGELFSPRYRRRTLLVWTLWFTTYLAFYGMWTWLPSLYTSVYRLPLEQSLRYSLFMQSGGLLGAFLCAVLIDRIGRRVWLSAALLLGSVPLFLLWWSGAPSAYALLLASVSAAPFIASVASALYLYTPEIYPTRMRALGSSVASAWLRFAAILGPMIIGWVLAHSSIAWAFMIFGISLVIGGLVTAVFADETKREVLEDVSP